MQHAVHVNLLFSFLFLPDSTLYKIYATSKRVRLFSLCCTVALLVCRRLCRLPQVEPDRCGRAPPDPAQPRRSPAAAVLIPELRDRMRPSETRGSLALMMRVVWITARLPGSRRFHTPRQIGDCVSRQDRTASPLRE